MGKYIAYVIMMLIAALSEPEEFEKLQEYAKEKAAACECCEEACDCCEK